MMNFSTNNDDYRNDYKLDNSAPQLSDSVSDISWITNQVANMFAATCWDGNLRVFELQQNGIFSKLAVKINSPLTACCWNNQNTAIYVGCGDGSIKAVDINTSAVVDIGKHQNGISGLFAVPGQNLIISTAYQNNICFWQPGNTNPAFSLDVGNKVFCGDFDQNLFVGGLGNEKIVLFDINSINQKSIFDSSELGKHSQIQSIAVNAKTMHIGVGSVDGRANISIITRTNNNVYGTKNHITFKANKTQQGGNTILYPVNSVGFNVQNDKWFMTAGSDGNLNIWDFQVKNKIKPLNYSANPICKAKVSPKGDVIAYGLGNDWHLGAQGMGMWQPKIGAHIITPQQTKYNVGKS